MIGGNVLRRRRQALSGRQGDPDAAVPRVLEVRSRRLGQHPGERRGHPLPQPHLRPRLPLRARAVSAGGAILCPNHTSVLDSFFVPALLPRRVSYVGKAEYMDDWKTRKLFPALGMIPIDREGGDAGERALATAQRMLEKGELFGIYPEGTRSRDGRLYRGHTGPARLALRTGAPIIPFGIQGAREVMPPDAKFPTLRLPVTISFGRPIDVTRYADRANDRLVLRQITDEVMYEIRELSGQEYVDEYANKKKKPEAVAPTEPQDS